ncbi:MAG: hypothetical protein E7182_03350 [Erysipelotrichaceae bacterium]|nr:hypothetical protein [Erysipelotrichaceae bacterium]
MNVLGVWGDKEVGIGDAFLIALIAIVIVFLTLLIIIGATFLFQKGIDVVQKHTTISPRPENKILEKDEDAVVAVLVATIEFHKATGKDCRVVKIERAED